MTDMSLAHSLPIPPPRCLSMALAMSLLKPWHGNGDGKFYTYQNNESIPCIYILTHLHECLHEVVQNLRALYPQKFPPPEY